MTDRLLLTEHAALSCKQLATTRDNARQRVSVIRNVEDVFNFPPPYRSPKKPNARYGPAVFDAIMMGNRGQGTAKSRSAGSDTNHRHGISNAVLLLPLYCTMNG